MKKIILLITTFLLATNYAAAKTPDQKISEILALPAEPEGVVIEIVTYSEEGLNWALPKAQGYVKRLRQRFPELHIAIVTHGREQFALQKKDQAAQKKVHSITQQLVSDDKVPVHVCGTYAGWKGVTEEDFPKYVDVAAAGPATINDYRALGYTLVKITRP